MKKIVIHQLVYALFIMIYLFVVYVSIPIYGIDSLKASPTVNSQLVQLMKSANFIYLNLFNFMIWPLGTTSIIAWLIDEGVTSIRYKINNYLHIFISLIFLILFHFSLFYIENIILRGALLLVVTVLLLFNAVVVKREYFSIKY